MNTMNTSRSMTSIHVFEQYADAFESSLASDDWSQLANHFAAGAVYESADGVFEGNAAIVEQLRRSVNALDYLFETRELASMQISETDGVVNLRFEAVYRFGDLPALTVRGTERAWIEAGRIVRMVDDIDPGALAGIEAWFEQYGELLPQKNNDNNENKENNTKERTMRIVVFGATGTMGRNITEQALAAGHQVTGFARHASSLDIDHERLSTIDGDVLDQEQVKAAIRDHDAVIFAVGAGAKGGVRARGTATVVRAMKSLGLRRLIVLSTLGAGDSWKHLNFVWKYLMFGMLLRQAYTDHKLQESLVRESGLDWTIVRPSAFSSKHIDGELHHGSLDGVKDLMLKVPLAIAAAFMVSQVDSDAYLHATPAVSF